MPPRFIHQVVGTVKAKQGPNSFKCPSVGAKNFIPEEEWVLPLEVVGKVLSEVEEKKEKLDRAGLAESVRSLLNSRIGKAAFKVVAAQETLFFKEFSDPYILVKVVDSETRTNFTDHPVLGLGDQV